MNEQKADVVFTDPPYNVNYKGHGKKTNTIANDNMEGSAFGQFLEKVFKITRIQSNRVLVCTSFIVPHLRLNLSTPSKRLAWKSRTSSFGINLFLCFLGWELITVGNTNRSFTAQPKAKGSVLRRPQTFDGVGLSKDWCPNTLHGRKDEACWGTEAKQLCGVWQEIRSENTCIRRKTVELIVYALRNSSKSGDLVLDLFLGSGSTLI